MTDKSKPNKFPLLNFMGLLLFAYVLRIYWSFLAKNYYTELGDYAVANGYIEHWWLIDNFVDIMFFLTAAVFIAIFMIVFKPTIDYFDRDTEREKEEEKRRNKK